MGAKPENTRSFFPEIQGLRAIAVVTVLLYHVWPEFMRGGYIGVDVFFVISGYLITRLLYREATEKHTISLRGFYERRISRLLPASTLVLFAIAVTLSLLPQSTWHEVNLEILASALYVENWRLAWQAVDYLGAENAASPVRHFWSLSIEEQYYMFWPVLILVTLKFTRFFKLGLRRFLVYVLGFVFGCSLLSSIYLTLVSPPSGYFFTHSRVWELALGGLLVLNSRPLRSERKKRNSAILGFVAILYSAVFYSHDTMFPGYAALLPTMGTAAVIMGGETKSRFGVYRLLSTRPMQYLGDISYSLYLWHWPLIVYFVAIFGRKPGLVAGCAIIAISVGLAHFSKIWIEDRFRHKTVSSKKFLRPLQVGALCLILSLSVYGVINLLIGKKFVDDEISSVEYPGALALIEGYSVPKNIEPFPNLASLKYDLPVIYRNGCHVKQSDNEAKPCTFGDLESNFNIVLVGDSHAAQWMPTLEKIAKDRRWKLTVFTKSSCGLNTELTSLLTKPYISCQIWSRQVLEKLSQIKPNVIVLTQSDGNIIYGTKKSKREELMVSALRKTWKKIAELNTNVMILRDTPKVPKNFSDCKQTGEPCEIPVSKEIFGKDSLLEAARTFPTFHFVDLTPNFCTEKTCSAIVGNIYVWRDAHHLTGSFARSMAGPLGKAIDIMLEQ